MSLKKKPKITSWKNFLITMYAIDCYVLIVICNGFATLFICRWGACHVTVVFAVGCVPFSGAPLRSTFLPHQHHPVRLSRQLLSKPVRLCYTLCTLICASMWYLFCTGSTRKMHELLGTGTKTAMLFPVSYQLQFYLFILLIYVNLDANRK